MFRQLAARGNTKLFMFLELKLNLHSGCRGKRKMALEQSLYGLGHLNELMLTGFTL